MNAHPLSYVVRDKTDAVVEYVDTFGRACRVARHHGEGSTVTGSKGLVLYTAPAPKPKEPK